MNKNSDQRFRYASTFQKSMIVQIHFDGLCVFPLDDAIVPVTVEGYEKEFELVLENGYWKIDEGLGFL